MSEKLSVHIFDGKLQGIFKPSKLYSVDEKKEAFTHLIEKLNNQSAKMMVKIMITNLSTEKGPNYQQINNLDSSDILMDLIQCIDNTDVLKGLNEQLADIRNLGFCPSGRTTRLLQLWSAFVIK